MVDCFRAVLALAVPTRHQPARQRRQERRHFERGYAAATDGTTPIEGLYVASPSVEADRQAIMAAGRGARVGLTLVEDVRRERGYPDSFTDHYDWVRREAELDEEWSDRWREYFDDRVPDEERRIEATRETLEANE